MLIYREEFDGNSQCRKLGSMAQFEAIEEAMRASDTVSKDIEYDWRRFKQEMAAALILAHQLGYTQVVDAPDGVRWFVANE